MVNRGNRSAHSKIFALLAFGISFFTGLVPVLAVETTTPVQLNSTATDGKSYASKFAVSITRANNSVTQITTANVNEALTISATYYPDPAHVNKFADVFVVVRDGPTFYMKTVDGIFVKWDYPNLKSLKPFQENVMLTAEYPVSVYSGIYAAASTQNIYVGYMSKSSPALIYTPVAASFTVQNAVVPINPLTFYSDNIENALVQKRCIACHVAGGLAKDSRLTYERSSSTSTVDNFNTLKSLINSQPDPVNYVLTKVTGGNNHGGGAQLSQGSSDYNALSGFLQLVTGSSSITLSDAGTFFDGVTLQSRIDTLRRAAIMIAGRAPTAAEVQAVSSGDETTLRTTLRGLLTGTGFHKFLTEGTNDRLLTEAIPGSQVIDPAWPNFVKLVNTLWSLKNDAVNSGLTLAQANSKASGYYNTVADYAMRASVEEQVAYVVENDKPYTEILTGDYMMMTPRTNLLLDGTAVFKDPNNMYEFAPGKIGGFYDLSNVTWARDPTLTIAHVTATKGSPRIYPHAGILNNPVFLVRYPSTPTNRNRARARWTLLNFMDIDIEKSTQRPTDPAALADKNNPTMNNPNCYACHERMDPVAATFENYYDMGYYRLWTTDSLDPFYKKPPDGSASAYVNGDLWYRDMRSPGLLGQAITNTTEPLRDLVSLIVKDPSFARASVKFWWPSIMNSSVLLAPAVSTDADYNDRFAAYQAQSASIEKFATTLSKNWNLKDLLVEMMMSPWYRIDTNIAAANANAALLAGVGSEKLLTPERLGRKTQALTGFNWRNTTFPRYEGRMLSGLSDDYRLIYGGIDSLSVTERSRDMTPLMSNVAMTHALESACPVVLKEFALPDAKRLLFGGLGDIVTPVTEGAIQLPPASTGATDWVDISMSLQLNAGSKAVSLSLANPYCDYDTAAQACRSQRLLYVDNVQIKGPLDSAYSTYEITSSISKNYVQGCSQNGASNAVTTGGCSITVPFTATTTGTYQIKARVAAVQASTAKVLATLAVIDTLPALDSVSNGARAIKNKLVELHQILHGKSYAIDAPEITAAYKLFVDTWQSKTASNLSSSLTFPQQCLWNQDWNFLDGLGYTGVVRTVASSGTFYSWNTTDINPFLNDFTQDSLHTKQSWVVVMSYMLSHYNYLYE